MQNPECHMLTAKFPTLAIARSNPTILTIAKLVILIITTPTIGSLGKSASSKIEIPNYILWFIMHIMPM
jgi:Na+-translocating ferredoxin:NAD+ oxidoreductase RnfE subunit